MEVVIAILLFFFGALLSSFSQVLAERLPEKKTLLGKSLCPHCQHPLRLLDVFPVVGYLANLGKCHFCKKRIPIAHLIIECLGGAVFMGSYLLYGFTTPFFIVTIAFVVLLVETLSDILYFEVIDLVWMVGLVPLILIRIFTGDFLSYLLSASVMFAWLFLLAFLGGKLFKKEVLGGGDVKLYLFIGFVLTLSESLLSLFFAAVFGFLFAIIFLKQKNKPIPLVPFIALGVFVAFFLGKMIIDWYVGLF